MTDSWVPVQLNEIAEQKRRESDALERQKDQYVEDSQQRLSQIDFGRFSFSF